MMTNPHRWRIGLVLLSACLTTVSTRATDWIAADSPRTDVDATSFVTTLTNANCVVKAEWRVSGLGVFQAFVNGSEVGDFLKPGYTHVAKCRHEYVYDVTKKLKTAKGAANVLSATVTAGWWRDSIIDSRDQLPYEDEADMTSDFLGSDATGAERFVRSDADNAFRGELTLVFADGSSTTHGTDRSWRAARTGCVRQASIYSGETYDARIDESWRMTGCVDWPAAKIDRQFSGEIRPAAARVALREDLSMKPQVIRIVQGSYGATESAWGMAREVASYRDGESFRLKPGEQLVVDFGQNAAAVCSLDFEGAADTVMIVRHAEMLNEGGGEKSRGNDGPEGTLYLANLRGTRASVLYTLKAGRQTYRPSYSFFGYRYVGITVTAPVTFFKIRSIPVTSITHEMENGRLVTGRSDVNRFLENVRWGMFSNYLSVPTDCPQRNERLGWTGDTQVFSPAALYLADVAGFLGKWLADVRDSQLPNGAYRSVAPVGGTGRDGSMTGWADAGVIVPYRIWRRTGNSEIIRTGWDSMVRFMKHLEAVGGYDFNRTGDWLSYESNDEHVKEFLNVSHRVQSAMMMAEMARATGREEESLWLSDMERRARMDAQKFFDEDGLPKRECRTQTTLIFTLDLGLVAGNKRSAVARELVANVRAHGDRLQTGFLGTARILDTLTSIGEAELAYTLLLQHAEPSWLYSVDQGATTVWERWNSYTREKGFGPASMTSFNHYAYGAVVAWLYSTAAGIREHPEKAGMREFVLAPQPDVRIGSLSASYRTTFGTIESSWRYEADGAFVWTYVIPEGSFAEVRSPGSDKVVRKGPGHYEERLASPGTNPIRPIAGLSKAIVSALVLTLVDEGKLDLDAPVSHWLGDPTLTMTLRQALSCTAGFMKPHPCYPADTLTMTVAVGLIGPRKALVARPGSRFIYSPWGSYVAMAVVEKVMGCPFDELLEEKILRPLGMSDTVFVPTVAMAKRIPADVHVPGWFTEPWTDRNRKPLPDCGLFSTRSDLESFGRMLASGGRTADGRRLLSEGSAASFFIRQTGDGLTRRYSFGFNVLSSDEIAFTSASGCSLKINRRTGSVSATFLPSLVE